MTSLINRCLPSNMLGMAVVLPTPEHTAPGWKEASAGRPVAAARRNTAHRHIIRLGTAPFSALSEPRRYTQKRKHAQLHPQQHCAGHPIILCSPLLLSCVALSLLCTPRFLVFSNKSLLISRGQTFRFRNGKSNEYLSNETR